MDNKIICSVEDWDSILNYYRPNGSSKTWYIKETKNLSIPYMWSNWNLLDENGNFFQNGHIEIQTTPNHSNFIEYIPKNKLGDSPHIYIINVYCNDFFNRNREIGFDCVSSRFMDDIRNGKSKILLMYLYEGYSNTNHFNDFEIIEEWRIKSNLPENSIYFLNGNLLSEEIIKEKNLKYKAVGIQYFEPWNKYRGKMVEFKPGAEKYLFLSYNRQCRHHRIRLMIDLLEKDLVKKGLISLDKPRVIPYECSEEIKQFLMEQTPLTIDSLPELKYNLAVNITFEDYEKTFISVITETLVDDGTLFFSEKIWKPIMVGHPFMVYGNQYSLRHLKKLGFKTFDKWIDENYDNEPNRDIRCKMIVEEVEKFNQKSVDELIKIRQEMHEICEHNFRYYNTYYNSKYDKSDQSLQINNVLIEIWNEINGGETKFVRNII